MTRQYSVRVSTVNIPTQLLSCPAVDCVETCRLVVSLCESVVSLEEVMSLTGWCHIQRSCHVILRGHVMSLRSRVMTFGCHKS